MTTQTQLHPEMTVATIAGLWPRTAAVFAGHGLDLCCGGSKTLRLAAQAHGLPLEGLMEELRAVSE
jgi:regulator of cell morphogenesis and NO signaling